MKERLLAPNHLRPDSYTKGAMHQRSTPDESNH
ncbi:hypothetical protein LUZ100_gp07 [Pseudomonas phage LUZ100]|nr:hypothetical protein LUZ100_gp07 [Pseudomonas phage LUZ100]